MKRLIPILAFLPLVFPFSARAQDAPVDSLALARQYSLWLYEGQVDSLLAHSNEEMRQSAVAEDTYGRLSALLAERAGFEIRPVDETWKLRNGRCQYWRRSEFSDAPEHILIRWVIDPDGKISGLGAGPASQAPPVEAETCAAPATQAPASQE